MLFTYTVYLNTLHVMHIIDKTIDFSIFMQISDIFLWKNMNILNFSKRLHCFKVRENCFILCNPFHERKREKFVFHNF